MKSERTGRQLIASCSRQRKPGNHRCRSTRGPAVLICVHLCDLRQALIASCSRQRKPGNHRCRSTRGPAVLICVHLCDLRQALIASCSRGGELGMAPCLPPPGTPMSVPTLSSPSDTFSLSLFAQHTFSEFFKKIP